MRWVKQIKSQYPRCRICHFAHSPNDFCHGSEDDMVPPATPEEARKRKIDLLVRDFGSERVQEFIRREGKRIEKTSSSRDEFVARVNSELRAQA